MIDFFWHYSWPGNVRELEHIIESAVNQAGPQDDTLDLKHCYLANLLGRSENKEAKAPDMTTIERHSGSHSGTPLQREKETLEQTQIIKALKETGGNVAAAARILSLSRQLLGYKIKKLNLRPALNDIRYKPHL